MAALVFFNALMVLVGAGIGSQVVPTKFFRGLLTMLHNTVGITTPSPDKERMVAVIWIATVTLIVDGMVFLLLFLTWKLT